MSWREQQDRPVACGWLWQLGEGERERERGGGGGERERERERESVRMYSDGAKQPTSSLVAKFKILYVFN